MSKMPFFPIKHIGEQIVYRRRDKKSSFTLSSGTTETLTDFYGNGIFVFGLLRSGTDPRLIYRITIDYDEEFDTNLYSIATEGRFFPTNEVYIQTFDQYNDVYVMFIRQEFPFSKHLKVELVENGGVNNSIEDFQAWYKIWG